MHIYVYTHVCMCISIYTFTCLKIMMYLFVVYSVFAISRMYFSVELEEVSGCQGLVTLCGLLFWVGRQNQPYILEPLKEGPSVNDHPHTSLYNESESDPRDPYDEYPCTLKSILDATPHSGKQPHTPDIH